MVRLLYLFFVEPSTDLPSSSLVKALRMWTSPFSQSTSSGFNDTCSPCRSPVQKANLKNGCQCCGIFSRSLLCSSTVFVRVILGKFAKTKKRIVGASPSITSCCTSTDHLQNNKDFIHAGVRDRLACQFSTLTPDRKSLHLCCSQLGKSHCSEEGLQVELLATAVTQQSAFLRSPAPEPTCFPCGSSPASVDPVSSRPASHI